MAEDNPVSGFLRFYRIFRWIVLIALVIVVGLALKRPGEVPDAPDPAKIHEHAQEFEAKLEQLEGAKSKGDAGARVELSSEQVTAAFAQSIAAQNGTTLPSGNLQTGISSPQTSTSPKPSDDKQPPIKDVRVAFDDDRVIGFFVTELYGKDVAITVAGRLGSSNGYVTFAPTEFKVGSLSIPVSLVESALQRKMNEPETREKLKLPDFIGDIRVQNGQLVMIEK